MGEAYIELFSSTGCQDCDAVKELLNQIITRYTGVDVEIVDIGEDVDRAEEYGIISVPSIVINGELYFTGEVPDPVKLEDVIQQEIK
jgi:glutaredoxin